MTDIIIIGAGAAGLTAAIYAVRAGLTVKVYEKNFYGGQIAETSEVENYPAIEKITGVELATNIYNQAVAQGVEIVFEAVTSVELSKSPKVIHTAQNACKAKAVILANGVKRRKLGCPGEESLTGRGVSYCATCDGAFFKDRVTAVVGGGNTALEDALYLSNICKKVYLIHRRDAFRGEKALEKAVYTKKNIEILFDAQVTEIKGEQRVNAVTVSQSEKEPYDIPVDAIFIAIGLMPDNSLFASEVSLDAYGYFDAGEDCKTNLQGVFAAGDSRAKLLRQIITAASDGAVAAQQAFHFINEHYSE